jgi:lipopolysaccharide export system permease protein
MPRARIKTEYEVMRNILKHYVRYVASRILGPFVLISLSITCIIWLTQSLRFIDLIINRGLNVTSFLYLSVLLIPSLLAVVIPVALVVSIVHAYNKLSVESELVALKSAGLSKLEIIKPALMIAVLATCISYSITLYVQPTSYREFKDMQAFIRDNYASLLLQEGVFNTPIKGLTVYIRESGDNGMMKGLLVHDNRDLTKPITMMAEEGQLIRATGGPRFILINGNRQEVDRKNGQLSLLYFERYALDLSSFAGTTQVRWREPDERYLDELFWPRDDTASQFLPKLRAEGHNRLTWPLYNMLMALAALLPFTLGEFNRRGLNRRILVSTGLVVGLLTLGLSMKNMASNNPAVIPAMYLVIFATSGSMLFFMLRNARKKRWFIRNNKGIAS